MYVMIKANFAQFCGPVEIIVGGWIWLAHWAIGRPRRTWLESVEADMTEIEINKEMEKECYEEEVQPYRKTDYKPIIYIYI